MTDKKVTIRFSKDQMDAIKIAADDRGCSVPYWMQRTICTNLFTPSTPDVPAMQGFYQPLRDGDCVEDIDVITPENDKIFMERIVKFYSDFLEVLLDEAHDGTHDEKVEVILCSNPNPCKATAPLSAATPLPE